MGQLPCLREAHRYVLKTMDAARGCNLLSARARDGSDSARNRTRITAEGLTPLSSDSLPSASRVSSGSSTSMRDVPVAMSTSRS